MARDELKEYLDAKLAEMPKDVLEKAVTVIRDNFTPELQQEIRDLYKEKGNGWITGHHHMWGMQVRNLLRENGLTDDLLPDGHWDDYYSQVVELAVGIRGQLA